MYLKRFNSASGRNVNYTEQKGFAVNFQKFLMVYHTLELWGKNRNPRY